MKLNWTIVLLGTVVSFGCNKKTDETTAIKKLLAKESASWRSGNAAAHADCWQVQPYSRILVSTPGGQTFDVPASNMTKPSPDMGHGGVAVNSNYLMHITGNNAWVSHDEISTAPDGIKTYSHEIRMVEKIDGQWKLVGQSIHLYNPK